MMSDKFSRILIALYSIPIVVSRTKGALLEINKLTIHLSDYRVGWSLSLTVKPQLVLNAMYFSKTIMNLHTTDIQW